MALNEHININARHTHTHWSDRRCVCERVRSASGACEIELDSRMGALIGCQLIRCWGASGLKKGLSL